MALPESRNIDIYKGDTYGFSFRLRDRTPTGARGAYVDLTGCTAKAQIRSTEDTPTVLVEFTASIPNQTVAENKGRVNLALTPAQTAALTFTKAVWDVQITFPDGVIRTYLKGAVTLTKEVTRV